MASIFGKPTEPAAEDKEVTEGDINNSVPASLPIATLNTLENFECLAAEVSSPPETETSAQIPPRPPTPSSQSRAPRASLFSSSTQHLLQSNNLNYNFRQGTNRHNFRGTGFIDHDTSGDYDPDGEKHKREYSERHNHRRRSIPEEYENDQEIPAAKRQNKGSRRYEQGRRNGDSKIVVLLATGEKIRDYLELKAIEDLENGVQNPQPAHGLRPRKRARMSYDKIQNGPSASSEEDVESLVGHPIARGCKYCFEIGCECSLINDPLHYPCEDCENDDCEVCVPIIPPIFKAPCENCRVNREYCSYRNDQGIDVLSCDNCLAAGKTCIAGPAKSMRMDDVLAVLESQKAKGANTERNILACTPCRKKKIHCSLKSKDDTEPCRSCRTEEIDCTFESIPRVPRAAKEKLTKTKDSAADEYDLSIHPGQEKKATRSTGQAHGGKQEKRHKREKREKRQYTFTYSSSPSSCSQTSAGSNDPIYHGAIRETITTAFCHPIEFNYRAPIEAPKYPINAFSSSSPDLPLCTCHFCHPGIPYALFGLGHRRVRVMRWGMPGGDGWEEEKGGWSSEGAEATRVCEECTLERVIIASCAAHRIRRIKGLDIASFDFDKPLRSVVERWKDNGSTDEAGRWLGLERMRKEDEVKWCNVCPAPAFYECCSADQQATEHGESSGCGLLLCDVCACIMCPKANWDGDGGVDGKGVAEVLTLDKLIHHASSDRVNYPDRLRADVEFLLKDGEMLRRLDAIHAEEMEREALSRNGFQDGDDDDEVEIMHEQKAVMDLTKHGGSQSGEKEVIDLTGDSDDEEGNGSERKKTEVIDLTEEWEQWEVKAEPEFVG